MKLLAVLTIAGLLALPTIGSAAPDTGRDVSAYYTNDVDWSNPDEWRAVDTGQWTQGYTMDGDWQVVIYENKLWFRDPLTLEWFWYYLE